MIWFHIIAMAVIAFIGHHLGAQITLSDLWPYIEALRTTTSIVFGVMGALLAIVFPEVLKQGLRPSGSLSDETNLRRVLLPCANAAILLIILVVLGPVFAWIKGLGTAMETEIVEEIQRYFFALFCVLSYWQIVILQMVLLPLETILSTTARTAAVERLRRGIHTNGRG